MRQLRDLLETKVCDINATFVRHVSRETFVRASHDCMTVVKHSRGCLATVKSRYGLIYVAYLSHCADRGNFLAMCLRTSAKGWRRVRDICDDLATVLR